MKNKKNKIKHRSEETEEDKIIIDIMCKLGGGLKEKNNQKIKQNKTKQTR